MKIPYYVTRKAWPGSRARWGYWSPSKKMKAVGFTLVSCGEDGPLAWAIAQQWNARWSAYRKGAGGPPGKIEPVYPQRSAGEAFARYRATQTWGEKKPRTREEWETVFTRRIAPVFGDVDLNTVTLADVDQWYAQLLKATGVREAHRAMKIWRAFWNVAAALGYCRRGADPSLGIRRKTPKPRHAIWREGEAVRLVKRAWRMGYKGLATALAVMWDTMLSPVDVRGLTRAQLAGDDDGPLFSLARAKTGKAAIGTFSKRTARLLEVYTATLPPGLHPSAPIFYTRGGGDTDSGGNGRAPAPYTKNTLGDDFRVVRMALFPDDKRKLMDFRRSGAVEATAGEVDPAALAGKMANTIDTNRELQATYQPHNATLVRLADVARSRGRARLRGNTSGSKS